MGDMFSHFKGCDLPGMMRKIREEAWEEVRREAQEEVRKEVQEEVRREVQEEIRKEAQEEVRREVQEEIRKEVQEEVRREVQTEEIEKLIKFGKRHGISREDVESDLREQYSLEEAEAAEKVEMYW